ncbi:MAG: hypothetical protein VB093_17080, partial [Propionicimonas sp.]|nr:hypothetical protein [Propionicimonas sp.]
QELKVNELEALSLVLGLPLSDLTNPRAASDRELRALEAELVAARDARWTADARLYETARKIGDTYLREGREVRAKAVTDLFERVLRVTPPRSVVPEFVRKDSRQAVYKIARVGLRHPAQLATLKAEAARSEKAIETLTRIRGRNPDDPELIDDLIELTRERLTNTYDQLEAISSYTH